MNAPQTNVSDEANKAAFQAMIRVVNSKATMNVDIFFLTRDFVVEMASQGMRGDELIMVGCRFWDDNS